MLIRYKVKIVLMQKDWVQLSVFFQGYSDTKGIQSTHSTQGTKGTDGDRSFC